MPADKMSRRWGCAAAVMVALAPILAAGCGGDSSSTSSDTSSGTKVSETTAPVEGVPTLQELYKGNYTKPPATSPAGAKGKSVWWIPCGLAAPACAIPAHQAEDAAKALGIDFHIADGKFNEGGAFNTALRTALAAKPDAILLHGLGCDVVRGALQDARAQGVLVMGVETPDCQTGEKLFSAEMKYGENFQDVESYENAYGAAGGNYIVNQSGGKAKLIVNSGTSHDELKMVDDGFRSVIEKCPDCEIVGTVGNTTTDLTPGGPWIQKFRSALVKYPQADSAYMPYEQMWALAGGAQAVAESGRKLTTFGGQGTQEGLDLVRAGKITAITSARATGWIAYGSMDSINRALQKKPAVVEGYGFQLLDKTHGLPPAGKAYEPSVDYKAAYLKAWKEGKG